jgi:hypothetical protein
MKNIPCNENYNKEELMIGFELDCPNCDSTNTFAVIGKIYERECWMCYERWDIRTDELIKEDALYN